MGRGGKTCVKKWFRDMQILSNGAFDWMEIYEWITYFPFSTRNSVHKNRNIDLNILLILLLTLKSVKMKQTAINSKLLFKLFHFTHN